MISAIIMQMLSSLPLNKLCLMAIFLFLLTTSPHGVLGQQYDLSLTSEPPGSSPYRAFAVAMNFTSPTIEQLSLCTGLPYNENSTTTHVTNPLQLVQSFFQQQLEQQQLEQQQ